MSIKNRLNRLLKKAKKALADNYFKRNGVNGFIRKAKKALADNYFKRNGVNGFIRKGKLSHNRRTPISPEQAKLRRMTNWQNSQWLRAGGLIHDHEANNARINNFLQTRR